jgi:ParB family chromosome partitioning protein
MTKKRGLGRGLGALIPDQPENSPEGRTGIEFVPILSIQPNPHQPRTSKMDEEKLAELAASIREHGLIQPLIVTRNGDNYTLIAGERRWRASQLISGITEIPVIVKEATPQEMLELAIIENIQRDDLNPLEEAYAYHQLMDEFHMTQEDVALRVGKGRSTVANLVRLLNLPPNIQQAVTDGQISGAHARALLPLPTPEAQTNAMNVIIKHNYSVRQTEALVKNLMAEGKPATKQRHQLSPHLSDLQTQFREKLSTKVTIVTDEDEEEGKVVIHFYSDEDLQNIFEAITKRKEE